MLSLVSVFIMLQIILLFIIALHDWIHLPPLTDIRTLEKLHSKKDRLIASTIYTFIVLIPLLITWYYRARFELWVLITIIVIYGVLSLGTIASWWVPYFFGSSEKHKAGFVEYQNTHRFLPSRGDNVVPNTFHAV